MEDTDSSQTSRPSFDPVVRAFATAIFEMLTSRAALPRVKIEDVRAEADRIADENADFGVDAAGRRWLVLCAVLLAAYRRLLPAVGNSATGVALLQTSMTTPFRAGIQAFIRDRFGISQDAPHEAFDRIAETFQTRGEQRFGRAFTFVPIVTDDKHSFTNITRCLFNDFFRANGVPELTQVCCAMDLVWADELALPRYGVRFERSTTLAAGDDGCRFRFFKDSITAGGQVRQAQ
jgi:hypothetical protein